MPGTTDLAEPPPEDPISLAAVARATRAHLDTRLEEAAEQMTIIEAARARASHRSPPEPDPVAEFLATPSTPAYAHQVAPAPDGHDWFDPTQPAGTLLRDLAAHHAARAWGFYQTAQDVNRPRFVDAMAQMLAEYQLARVWYQLACTDAPDAEAIAVDVVTDIASPQVIGPNILELLEWAGIAPGAIRAYMAEVTGMESPEATPWPCPNPADPEGCYCPGDGDCVAGAHQPEIPADGTLGPDGVEVEAR